MSDAKKTATYGDAGVKTSSEAGLQALLKAVVPTAAHRAGRTGRSILPIGYFANVIDLGGGMGLALSTDGVGTKVLVAEIMGKYDTIGIDCVAMNVNDVICVGAEPMTMLDYLAVERSNPEILEAIGRGLAEGAAQAGVNIAGGEFSQMGDVIKGYGEGTGVDLVGMCVGLVELSKVNIGQDVVPGDQLVGLSSSGIHSNGLTLARRVLLDEAKLDPAAVAPDLGRSVGEELLEPTRIYVRVVKALWDAGVETKALAHITGDGFLNLCRIEPALSFRIHTLPEPPPIFSMIQRLGGVDEAEMYRVFNMGVGFCLVVPPDTDLIGRVREICSQHGIAATLMGEVVDDDARKVILEPRRLVGQGDAFRKTA